MPKPYQDFVRADGSASAKTIYGSKVPHGKVICITEICAVIYTTVVGDYTTSKYINLGMEIQGTKRYHMGRDISENQLVVRSQNCVWLKEGDRPFADFEATAATTTYELVINGLIYDAKELEVSPAKTPSGT
jgi:hypothetical protein